MYPEFGRHLEAGRASWTALCVRSESWGLVSRCTSRNSIIDIILSSWVGARLIFSVRGSFTALRGLGRAEVVMFFQWRKPSEFALEPISTIFPVPFHKIRD